MEQKKLIEFLAQYDLPPAKAGGIYPAGVAGWERYLSGGRSSRLIMVIPRLKSEVLSLNNLTAVAKFDTWKFEKDLSDKLIDLVLSGKKKATSSPHNKKEKIPEIGSFGIIMDYKNNPRCLIKYINLYTKPFDEVGLDFIGKEGEEFSSVEQWRDAHLQVFKNHVPDFNNSSLVICEEFELVK